MLAYKGIIIKKTKYEKNSLLEEYLNPKLKVEAATGSWTGLSILEWPRFKNK